MTRSTAPPRRRRALLPAGTATASGALAATLTALGLLAAAGCRESPELVDWTEPSGVEFLHDNGFRNTYYFTETVGSGVALADLDDDGDLDLYAVQCGVVPGTIQETSEPGPRPTNRLFANRLEAAGEARFDDVTAASGDAAHDGYGMGTCAGDVDGDGRLDLFLTNFGPDALLVNAGGLAFEDRAAGEPLADPRWTTGCGFGDLDQDGNLDLVVAGYVHWTPEEHRECGAAGVVDYCHVSMFDGIVDRVWIGDGRGGFSDASAEWGLAERAGRGFGIALVDLDDDGRLDLYVANDSVENHVYLNQDLERFGDRTETSGGAYNVDGMPEAGMGVAAGDYDGDGRIDVFVTNFAGESNALYGNLGGGRFRDASRQSGVTAHSRAPLGFGAVLADLDRDGCLDLVVSNGHVMRNAGRNDERWRYRQPDQLFRGSPEGRFEPWLTESEVLATPRVGRGLAAGDLDDDGLLDLVFLGSSERLTVVRNRTGLPKSGWLRVRLRGSGTNTAAVGAKLALELDDGTKLVRWVQSGTGFLSQDDLRPHFGIPPRRRPVALAIRWPDGKTSRVAVEAWNRTLEVRQPGPGAAR